MKCLLFRVCVAGKPSALYDKTNPDWAPTVDLGHDKFKSSLGDVTSPRYERTAGRAVKRRRLEVANTLLSMQDMLGDVQPLEVDRPAETELDESGQGCQTDVSGDALRGMEEEMRRLTLENSDLKRQLSSSKLTQSSLVGNDEKVKFLTGLPTYHILSHLFDFVSSRLTETHRSSLTKFRQLLLVLMKLRLNVSNELLAFIFDVTKYTVSRIFLHMLDVLHIMLAPLIIWPERDALRKTMPMEFRRYLDGRVVVIIDCFEVFIEIPSNLEARSLTWSSYKHHNTIKFLIGITPQGTISFLSRAWGGRVSDKFLTEHCGFLRKLLPGDVVMADRGFDVSDAIKMPAFTKGKRQMPAIELEKSRKLAHLRIHVERVIGLLRQKYSILAEIVPIDYLLVNDGNGTATVDKIAIVCSALINMSARIVPTD